MTVTRARATAQILDDLATGVRPSPVRNYIIDGGCRIARGAAINASTAAQYGTVDMFAGWASGTAVSAGTVTRSTSSAASRTGRALHLSGLTVTGTGIAKARHRIEAAEALQLKNATASFGVSVWHDVGSAVNYTIVVRKAGAADDFSSPTVIQTGSAVAVADQTATRLTLENLSMGDCSNGLEIEVQAACGAVTTKNFHFAEWQLEEGSVANSFRRESYAVDLERVNRHFRRYQAGAASEVAPAFIGEIGSTTAYTFILHPGMRAEPTVTMSGCAGGDNAGGFNVTLGSKVIGAKDGSQYNLSMASGGSAGRVGNLQVTTTAGAHLTLDARL